ncbi:hypothetical protein [Glaciecola sp. SC05]|uniref:hypothetical protein n=1 Tax=Glaciecola sp. SC05 TaxID=1987355 RepID=UPI003527E9EA
MKNLKPLIFAAHTELKVQIPSIKISHLYEAFAAFSGFDSYAAFKVSSVRQLDDIEQANMLCFDRMQNVGFDASSALLICKQIQELSKSYNSISLDKIYKFYSNELCEGTHDENQVLEALRGYVRKGDNEAVLLGIVFTTQLLKAYDEDPDNRSAEYWHKKLKLNHELSDLQQEIVLRYAYIKPYREFLDFLHSEISNNKKIILPSPISVREITLKFNDDVDRNWTQYFSSEPDAVQDAIAYISSFQDPAVPIVSEGIYRDWQKAEALNFASRWLIAGIVDFASTDEEKWFWYYIGLNRGVDITQSNLRAINADTGEDYDDYGPMDVVGDEGQSMPKATEELKSEMHQLATLMSSTIAR